VRAKQARLQRRETQGILPASNPFCFIVPWMAAVPFDSTRHHRQSLRLRGYDYAQAGAYFVTLCTHGHECLFGNIVDGVMRLGEAGRIVEEEWLRSSAVRREIVMDALVVMPNHLHGIVIIHDVGATGRSPTGQRPPV
jgi:putative transposase